MILKMFTVYDSKAEAYLRPFYMNTKGEAIRLFTDMANDQNHQFFKHPEDYTLFELGDYEDTNGSFDLCKTPMAIGKALEFKTQREMFPDTRQIDMKGFG